MAAQIEWRKGLQKMRIDAKLDALPAKLLSHFLLTIVQQRLIGQVTQFLGTSLSDCQVHHPFAHRQIQTDPGRRRRCQSAQDTHHLRTNKLVQVELPMTPRLPKPTARRESLEVPEEIQNTGTLTCPRRTSVLKPSMVRSKMHPQNQAPRDPVARPCPKDVCATCP